MGTREQPACVSSDSAAAAGAGPRVAVSIASHIGYLDGVRGLAALWVMVGHILERYGLFPPIISWTSLAVDVFIVLSGFLMVVQTTGREERESVNELTTWLAFWLRRFFRIAPVYYCVFLVVTILEQSQRGFDGAFLSQRLPENHIVRDQFAENIFSHITFLFGMSPEYHRTNLTPDWSISLEMQFYALFPILFLTGRRLGWLILTAAVIIVCVGSNFLFAPFLQQFSLPSIIILKLNVFLGGMLVAVGMLEERRRWVYLLIAMGLMLLPIWGSAGPKLSVDRALICLGFGMLAFSRYRTNGLWKPISRLASYLGSSLFVVMASLSYSVYLVHYPILVLWSKLVADGMPLSRIDAPAAALLAVPMVSYYVAFFIHRAVELPGIELGRKVISYAKAALRSSA